MLTLTFIIIGYFIWWIHYPIRKKQLHFFHFFFSSCWQKLCHIQASAHYMLAALSTFEDSFFVRDVNNFSNTRLLAHIANWELILDNKQHGLNCLAIIWGYNRSLVANLKHSLLKFFFLWRPACDIRLKLQDAVLRNDFEKSTAQKTRVSRHTFETWCNNGNNRNSQTAK